MALAQTVLIAGLGTRVEDFLIPILNDHGYEVRTAIGLNAVAETLSRTIDLVLLDLPSSEELPQFVSLRASCEAAMIVVGPGRDDRLLIDTLELGADDYVARPFRTTELMARIRAQLRRNLRSQNFALTFGALSIDPYSRQASYAGDPLDLSPEEFSLLTLLAARPGHLYPATFLTAQIWGSGQQGDLDVLARTIAHLRSLFEPNPLAPSTLGGDNSRGYWLGGVAPVARELNGE